MNTFDKFMRTKFGKIVVGVLLLVAFIAVGEGVGSSSAGGLTGAAGVPAATQAPTATPTVESNSVVSAPQIDTATNTPIPTLALDPINNSEKDGAMLVFVPAGDFLMGSNNSDTQSHPDETPQHSVTLDAFWIDQTEVTNAMYTKCVDAGQCALPENTDRYSSAQYVNYPVVYVSWNAVVAYCSWAGRRLPTEAEWEKAARGTDGRIFPWGNDAPNSDLVNFRNEFGAIDVGKFPNGISPYGALDMSGNVWEWVNDRYEETYYQSSPSVNPLGPDSGQNRVLRGGAWSSVADSIRVAYRSWVHPTSASNYYGFRCARGASQ